MRRVSAGGIAVGLAALLLTGCVASPGSPASVRTGTDAAVRTPRAHDAAASAPTPSTTPGAPTAKSDDRGTGADLPQGLDTALRRDLGITPEQYAVDAAAAGRASDIAPELAAGGIALDQVWMDGSTIKVHVATAAQRSLAASLGATPTAATPPTGPDLTRSATAYDDLDDGTGWYLPVGGSSIAICSTGFNGFGAGGAPTMATAGHCLLGNTPVPADPVLASRYLQSAPGQAGTASNAVIGTLSSGTFMFGGGNDSGLIPVTGANLTPRGQVSTWNGSTIAVRGMTNATVGAPICKSGRTTGWTCGKVLAVNYDQGIQGDGGSIITVNSIATSMCMWHGDSGGPAMIGSLAVGINSSGTWSSQSCSDAQGYSAIYPLGGDADSLTQKQPGWQLQVAIDTPILSSTVGGATPTVSGTVPNAVTGTSVSLHVDGSSTAAATATVAADGTWSFAPTGLSAGVHTVSVTASSGSYNRSAPSAPAYLPIAVQTSRIAGADRVQTAIAASQAAYPGRADVVYVAYGWNFPDALVSSAAAVHGNGPVLLSPSDAVPQTVIDEIARLSPQKIVVVGGTASLAPAVESALHGSAPTVERVDGLDRFDTARRIVADAFGAGPVAKLYIASGVGFPDALSAAAAAAAGGAPVLTVQGDADALDTASVNAIRSLHPQSITVVGGPASVTPGVYAGLAALAPSIARIGGPDRFATSQLVAQSVYSSATTAYLASGLTFPDALTGSVAAAVAKKPLLITPGTCAASTVTSSLAGWRTTGVVLVGGSSVLTDDVAALRSC